jgi:hypothetical protein
LGRRGLQGETMGANISLIRIVTMNPLLYTEYIIIKTFQRKKKHKERYFYEGHYAEQEAGLQPSGPGSKINDVCHLRSYLPSLSFSVLKGKGKMASILLK